MKYGITKILKHGLLLRPDGLPFKSQSALRKRIKKFGIKPTKMNQQGTLTYEISITDINKMNSYNYESKKRSS